MHLFRRFREPQHVSDVVEHASPPHSSVACGR
jgi:hypothetical protein